MRRSTSSQGIISRRGSFGCCGCMQVLAEILNDLSSIHGAEKRKEEREIRSILTQPPVEQVQRLEWARPPFARLRHSGPRDTGRCDRPSKYSCRSHYQPW